MARVGRRPRARRRAPSSLPVAADQVLEGGLAEGVQAGQAEPVHHLVDRPAERVGVPPLLAVEEQVQHLGQGDAGERSRRHHPLGLAAGQGAAEEAAALEPGEHFLDRPERGLESAAIQKRSYSSSWSL